MKRAFCAVAVLAAFAAVIGRATAAGSAGLIVVRLPKHVFGHARSPDARVTARWGIGPGEVGYLSGEPGPNGGSSFDVLRGVVYILDENNGRVLAFAPGKVPRAIPFRGAVRRELRGDQGELAVGTDGTIYVLELHGLGESGPLWSFPARGGRPLAKVLTLGEAVRSDGAAAIIQATEPGVGKKPISIPDHWRQVMVHGRAAGQPWIPYRPLPDGGRLAVRPDAPHGVVRLTLTQPGGGSTSWVVKAPDMGLVEDTDVVGSNVVLVLRFSNDHGAEEEAVVLGRHGLVRSFSTQFSQFAEPNLDSSVRVVGSSLYQLGSTLRDVYVDRYSL